MEIHQKQKIRYWTKKEGELFDDFVKREKTMLCDNFYRNLKSQTSKKKSKGFFRKMSIFIGTRNPNQCKSKFQKLERYVFITKLDIAKVDYEMYLKKRKLKTIHNKKITKKVHKLKIKKKKEKKIKKVEIIYFEQEVKKIFPDELNLLDEKNSKNFLNGTLENDEFKDIFFENDDFVKKKYTVQNINSKIDCILKGLY